MRLPAPSLPLLLAALATLAGCQAFAPQPDPATLPHATIAGTHVDAGQRVDTFRLLAVDGHAVLPYTDEPAKQIGHDASNVVVAGRAVRLEIEGFGFYDNAMRRLFWDPMRAQGVVEFVPVAGATYSLRGARARGRRPQDQRAGPWRGGGRSRVGRQGRGGRGRRRPVTLRTPPARGA